MKQFVLGVALGAFYLLNPFAPPSDDDDLSLNSSSLSITFIRYLYE